MFKFMKSKKGFTLVELMIVVVIMAILVAVAVPIFSAVTANAKKKTCIGNQREIISSVGNWLMLEDDGDIKGTFTTSGGQEDPTLTVPSDGTLKDYATTIEGLFKTVPVCPDGNTINVLIVEGDDKASVYVACAGAGNLADDGTFTALTEDGNGHIVPGTDD